MKVDIIGTAAEVTDERVTGCDVAVIDVFRATSVMVTAFENGAKEIIPVTGVDESFELRDRLQQERPGEKILLGGERKTVIVEGFDLDNSPLRYSRDVVEGATVVMSTTNGTRALNSAASADDIYVAAFLNADAVARRLGGGGKDVVLVCSGRQNRFTVEDGLCAGMLARYLGEYFEYQMTDFAWWCADLYERWQWDVIGALDHCEHYHSIKERWADDIQWCLRRNVSDAAPKIDKKTGGLKL